MRNLLLLAMTLVYFYGSSQDLIILKTGDEIKGKVIKVGVSEIEYKKETNSPVYAIKKSEVFIIKYENGSKDVFTNTESPAIKPAQPEATEKETYHKEAKKSSPAFHYDSLKTNCYQPILEFGGLFGVGNVSSTNSNYYIPYSSRYYGYYYYYSSRQSRNTQNLFSLRFIQGKRIKGDQFVGVGVELDISDRVDFFRNMYFPFFIEYRNTFTKGRVTPMFVQDLGGSFYVPTYQSTYAFAKGVVAGGVLANTSLGINVHITNKISYHFTLGYRFQHLTTTQTRYTDYNGQEVNLKAPVHNIEHFVTLTTGFRF